jgi:hypothetical protein
MALGCSCNVGLSNTGRPNCVPIFSVVSNLIAVPLFANDGTRNGIDLSAAVPTWANLINEDDRSKRWFPLPAFENVEMPKADSQFEEANSGRMVFLRQGKRSFAGELWADDSTPTFLGKLQGYRCVDFGVYVVDVNGNLIGSQENGFLYPIPVDNPSWDPRFMFATDSTTQKIMLGFDFDRLFDDSTMYMITPDEAGVNFGSLKGLIDVNLDETAHTTSSVTVEAAFDYGTAYNKILFKGAVAADFSVYNNTTAAAVTISSCVEGPDGTYVLSYSAQTAGDSLTVEVIKLGFDGNITFTV